MAEYFASIKFLDDSIKYYHMPVTCVFFNAKDQEHIKPNDINDYDQKHRYYISWKDNMKYPGHIVCLGESLEDAQNRAATKSKRLIIPKKLTSSEDEFLEENDVNPLKLKLCKKVSQTNNTERIIQTYKSQVLLNNRTELVLATSENIDPITICAVILTDCLNESTNPKKGTSIVSNASQNCSPTNKAEETNKTSTQKARKSFPSSAPVIPSTSQVSASCSSPFPSSQDELQQLRDRLNRLREVTPTTDVDQSEHSETPTSSIKSRFSRLRARRTLEDITSNNRSCSRSPVSIISNASNINDHEKPQDQTRLPHVSVENNENAEDILPNILRDNQRDSNTPHEAEGETASDSEDDTAVNECKHLYIYKKNLYKLYKKNKIDMKAQIPEHHTRYESVNEEEIHLGENITVGEKSWRMTKAKKYMSFLRDLGGYIWKNKLPHRCLNLVKAKKSMPTGHELKLCSPRKLNLYLSVYEDYLKENKRYKNLTVDEHDIMVKNSTEVLSYLIRDERKIFLDKIKRRSI